jgi:hypothetical protein
MMVFRLWSKSTKVLAGHSLCRSFSWVTTSPGRSTTMSKVWNGCSSKRTRTPDFGRSPLPGSASNDPKPKIARHHNLIGRTRRGNLLLVALLAFGGSRLEAEQLKGETVKAFDHYVELSEQRMASELRSGHFLHVDELSASLRDADYTRLRQGEVVTERLTTLDEGHSLSVPGGLVHHWMGTVFIPGTTLVRTLAFLEDYNDQYKYYAPEVQQSKLLERDGNHFRIFLRLRKTKVVTVILNTEYDVQYVPLASDRAASYSYSRRIAEVENAGKPNESEKPVGNDSGFLWRLNSYWRFLERDGGVYIELEAISLTRDIPPGLRWLIGPFVTSIPKESLQFTLTRTREALANQK